VLAVMTRSSCGYLCKSAVPQRRAVRINFRSARLRIKFAMPKAQGSASEQWDNLVDQYA
jgi:hypothetical protein